MEKNWTTRTKNGPKKYAYELMKELGYTIFDPDRIHPAGGGYKISYLCDSKQDAEETCQEARQAARELGIRVYKTNTVKYVGDAYFGETWKSEYRFLYDSEDPRDIREWNRLMDEYEMPLDLELSGELETADYRGAGYGYHENLGIKFIDVKANRSPNFDAFMAKAATRRYWANIIVEPYYPEEE